jgi:hypothetical protein
MVMERWRARHVNAPVVDREPTGVITDPARQIVCHRGSRQGDRLAAISGYQRPELVGIDILGKSVDRAVAEGRQEDIRKIPAQFG